MSFVIICLEFNCIGGVKLWLKAKSAKKLGFKPIYLQCGDHESDNVFDLNAGQRLLYVYYDIGLYGLVGGC